MGWSPKSFIFVKNASRREGKSAAVALRLQAGCRRYWGLDEGGRLPIWAKMKIATVMRRVDLSLLLSALLRFQRRAEWARSGLIDPLSGRYGCSAVKLQEHRSTAFLRLPAIATCGGYVKSIHSNLALATKFSDYLRVSHLLLWSRVWGVLDAPWTSGVERVWILPDGGRDARVTAGRMPVLRWRGFCGVMW
jgi:hypothetical protein